MTDLAAQMAAQLWRLTIYVDLGQNLKDLFQFSEHRHGHRQREA